MLLGTVSEDALTQEPVVDLGDDMNLHIGYTRTGWIVFTPMNDATRENCKALAALGYIRPHGYGYVSAKQTVLMPMPGIEKTRRPRASR